MDEDEMPEGEMVELDTEDSDVEDTEDGGAIVTLERDQLQQDAGCL